MTERATYQFHNLDQHPIIAARGQQLKKLRCQRQKVLRIRFPRQLRDDVDGGRYDAYMQRDNRSAFSGGSSMRVAWVATNFN